MIKIIISLIIIFLTNHVNLFSQTISKDSIVSLNKKIISITDTTYECTVVTASRSVYKDVNMYGLRDSSIKILKKGVARELFINDIRTLKFNARGFGKGALIGAAAGFVLGFVAGGQGFGFNNGFKIGDGMLVGFITAIPFCFIGGGLGVLFAEDQFFDLSNLDYKGKKDKLKYLILEFSDR